MCIKTSIPSVTRHNPQRQSHIPLNSSRSLAAALLALYIRYANYIEPPTSSTEEHIIPVLCLILKDSSLMKSDPVLRHKCIAALGELIFYISAQDDSSNTQWMLSNDIVLVFGRSLSDDTDEIMRHYAAKVISDSLTVPSPYSPSLLDN